jgi:hypothetical protein
VFALSGHHGDIYVLRGVFFDISLHYRITMNPTRGTQSRPTWVEARDSSRYLDACHGHAVSVLRTPKYTRPEFTAAVRIFETGLISSTDDCGSVSKVRHE